MKKYNYFAFIGIFFSLLGFLPGAVTIYAHSFFLIGIIFSSIGIYKSKKSYKGAGRGLAIAGLVTGIIGVLFSLYALYMLFKISNEINAMIANLG